MQLPIYQVDAFTDQVFTGNSAAVCPLPHWLSDQQMQQIAMENAVAETAFFIKQDDEFAIRWFTPEIEMDLCGHATLATAHVIKNYLDYTGSSITFNSASGQLIVSLQASEEFNHQEKQENLKNLKNQQNQKKSSLIHLNFPARMPQAATAPQTILDALSIKPQEVFKSRDYVLVFENEQQIKNITVNKSVLDQINLDPGGVIVTAKGEQVDFVSRFFTPQANHLEDPVTGSAHCSLIPFWSARLAKDKMTARQLSKRSGKLYCQNKNDRVIISGHAVTYMIGQIYI